MLVVHPSVGVKSVKELIALAKAKPDELSFGSSGVATGTHLAGELFKMQTGVKMVHVPYPGSPQAVTDLLAGRIQVLFSPASTVLPHVHDGKIVALASTEAKRTGAAPDLPTMQEAGLPGFETGLWFGLLAPAGTPPAVVDKLNRAANEALKAEEVTKALAPLGIDVVGGSAGGLRPLHRRRDEALGRGRRDGRPAEMITAKRFALALGLLVARRERRVARTTIRRGRCASSSDLGRAPPPTSPRGSSGKARPDPRPAVRGRSAARRRQQLAAEFVARAPKDGYTLLLGNVANTSARRSAATRRSTSPATLRRSRR